MRVHVFESMTEPVSTEKALEAIEKDGFYLTTGQIRLEEREG